jgi:hypothetical protein
LAFAVAIAGVIATELATLHASEANFPWWWPTDWMAVPAAIFIVGLILLVVPIQRLRAASAHSLSASSIEGWASFIENPGGKNERLLSGYRALAWDLAPENLVGRDAELAELARFCSGEDSYIWWQGVPWAGKTALAAWFTLHPPTGVNIASFFITSRLAGQSDSAAFTEAMVEQLAIYAGENVPRVSSPGGRDRERGRLLDLAGQRAAERGERLVLVVDGLDEDQSTRPSSGLPSIASLLPRHTPESVRVIVTSRVLPELPGYVPEDHPLRRCSRRELEPSELAVGRARLARQELLDQLQGDQLQVDIIGLLAAAEGGLTLQDLTDLTGQPRYEVESRLGTALGRAWRADDRYNALEQADRAYLFAHETLLVAARSELGGEISRFRTRIDSWADDYQARGWPPSTPQYLLRPYGRVIATERETDRLFAFATDPARHDRMLADTGGDATALAEIDAAQQLILADPQPALAQLYVLAFYRSRLTERNSYLPPELPAILAKLGYTRRAEQLARSLAYSESRVKALGELTVIMMEADRARGLGLLNEMEQIARASPGWSQTRVVRDLVGYMARAGEYERAEQLARTLTIAEYRASALGELALALATTNPGRARRLADEVGPIADAISDPLWSAPVQRLLASVAARTGDYDQAEKLALGVKRSWVRDAALRDVAAILADSGHYDGAERLAAMITGAEPRVGALAALVKVLARSDPERARMLANEAQQLASGIRDSTPRGEVAAAIADADPDGAGRLAEEAEQLARGAVDPGPRSPLAELAAVLASADPDRALRLAEEAEQLARDAAYIWPHTPLRELAEELAGAGDYEIAEQVIDIITAPGPRAQAIEALAVALAAAGERQRAEQLLETVSRDWMRGWTAEKFAVAVAKAGDYDHAEQLITTLTGYRERAAGTRRISGVIARGGEYDRAERLARTIKKPWHQETAMADLARVLTCAGQYDHAEHVARTIADPEVLARRLGDLAAALTDSAPARARSLADEAEQLIHSFSSPGRQITVLGYLSTALAKSDPRRAQRLADKAETLLATIDGLESRESALHELSRAAAYPGNYDHAEELARSITTPKLLAAALSDLSVTLCESDTKRACALVDEAGEIADAITDTNSQAAAMLNIARAFAARDTSPLPEPIRVRACRFLAQAVTKGSSWQENLAALAVLQPSALSSLGRVIVSRHVDGRQQ